MRCCGLVSSKLSQERDQILQGKMFKDLFQMCTKMVVPSYRAG